ncbi:MAG: hypothetical protein DHS20C02_00680 [Micavibrio sp.]|nr:MAG: hypothetical protein DHS20C02_00680 [Micavibrio sp.]
MGPIAWLATFLGFADLTDRGVYNGGIMESFQRAVNAKDKSFSQRFSMIVDGTKVTIAGKNKPEDEITPRGHSSNKRATAPPDPVEFSGEPRERALGKHFDDNKGEPEEAGTWDTVSTFAVPLIAGVVTGGAAKSTVYGAAATAIVGLFWNYFLKDYFKSYFNDEASQKGPKQTNGIKLETPVNWIKQKYGQVTEALTQEEPEPTGMY